MHNVMIMGTQDANLVNQRKMSTMLVDMVMVVSPVESQLTRLLHNHECSG